MGGILGFLFGGDTKTTTSTSTNANYNLTDNTHGAGDNSIVADNGASVNIVSTSDQLARDAMNIGLTLAGQGLGVAVHGQDLTAYNADRDREFAARLVEQNAQAQADANKASAASVQAALDAAAKSQREASALTQSISGDAIAASRAAASAAASAASDAALSASRSTDRAIAFGEDALSAVNTSQRSAFGFGSDALAATVAASQRATTAAENALDSSLGFARSANTASLDFTGTALNSVIKLVSDTAKSTQNEAQATRDFAGKFVGDFYESQKAGDVQTIQDITKYGAALGIMIAIAWALRGSKAA